MASRSAKVYKILDNNADLISQALRNMQSDSDQEFPRTEQVRMQERDSVEGIIWISRPNIGNLRCEFLFRTNTNKAYLLGTTEAREAAYHVLNDLDGLERNMTEMEITNRQLVDDVRNKLIAKHPRNFIKKMSLEFGVQGISYHNNTNLYKLNYELVENTCGSTHSSFDKFVNAAQIVKVRFGIFEFFNIKRQGKRDKPAAMNMSTNFTVSFYSDIECTDWYNMLDYLANTF